MAKTVTLKHVGYLITGEVEVVFWGGGTGFLQMDETKIPAESFTKSALLSAINDGKYGVEEIMSADLRILDLYQNGYVEFNRRVWVDGSKRRQIYFNRGIQRCNKQGGDENERSSICY